MALSIASHYCIHSASFLCHIWLTIIIGLYLTCNVKMVTSCLFVIIQKKFIFFAEMTNV